MIGDGGAAWGITAQIRGKRWLQLTAGARTAQSASWRCWSRYAAAAAGTFQYPKVRSTALSRRRRCCASRRRRLLPRPRRAQAVQSGLPCESTDCSCPCTSARCVCGWRAGKGEDGESKWGLAGRLLEATDIATKDNKILKEEVLSNTAFLHQHLVVRRRDLGDLEKSPITTSVDPSASAT
jgi:hypothetical protein